MFSKNSFRDFTELHPVFSWIIVSATFIHSSRHCSRLISLTKFREKNLSGIFTDKRSWIGRSSITILKEFLRIFFFNIEITMFYLVYRLEQKNSVKFPTEFLEKIEKRHSLIFSTSFFMEFYRTSFRFSLFRNLNQILLRSCLRHISGFIMIKDFLKKNPEEISQKKSKIMLVKICDAVAGEIMKRSPWKIIYVILT